MFDSSIQMCLDLWNWPTAAHHCGMDVTMDTATYGGGSLIAIEHNPSHQQHEQHQSTFDDFIESIMPSTSLDATEDTTLSTIESLLGLVDHLLLPEDSNEVLVIPDDIPSFGDETQLQSILSDIEAIYGSRDEDESRTSSSPSTSLKRPFEDDSHEEAASPSNSASPVHKKEANKRAAIRYRSKKQKEKDELFAECEQYAQMNAKLRSDIEDVEGEIGLIKNLLVQALIAKNAKK